MCYPKLADLPKYWLSLALIWFLDVELNVDAKTNFVVDNTRIDVILSDTKIELGDTTTKLSGITTMGVANLIVGLM